MLILNDLLQRYRDEPLTVHDAMLLSGALTGDPDPGSGNIKKEMERMLTDKKTLGEMQTQRETIVEVYAERDRVTPHEVISGDMNRQIQAEPWTSSTSTAMATSTGDGG